jgi:hypothetical protein
MAWRRPVEPFEPVLIEKRGQRRLPERRFPDNAEQRGRRLIRLARQRRQNRGALGSVTIERIGARPEPELDQPTPGWRGQCEMGDLVQYHVSFGGTIQCHPVPIETARGPFRVDRHGEDAGEGERCEAMMLRLSSGGAVG